MVGVNVVFFPKFFLFVKSDQLLLKAHILHLKNTFFQVFSQNIHQNNNKNGPLKNPFMWMLFEQSS
jgi:hypothetical protein